MKNVSAWQRKHAARRVAAYERKLGIVVAALVVGLITTLVACEKPPTTPEERHAAELQQRVWGDDLAARLLFFRDQRSGLCFAYTLEREGRANWLTGGPAMSEVDCANVEKLLVNPAQPPAPAEAPPPAQTQTAP